MNILIICGLSNDKLLSKLAPLMASPRVNKIYIVRKEKIAGEKIVCFSPPRILRLNILFAEAYRIIILLYLCLIVKIDMLVGIYLFPHGIYATLLGNVFKKKIVLLPLGTDLFWNIVHSKFGKMWLWLFKKADFIGVRGGNSKAYLIEQGISPKAIFIPPNVFDFDRFSPKKHPAKYHIITVGSLVPDKRMDVLLHAVAKVTQKFNPLKVAVIGSGKLRKKLERMTRRLDLSGNVDFLGDKGDVESYLNSSKIFVLTSRTEGLPMAMIEALSCGLPVVVPDVGDINTVAKDEVNAQVINTPTPDAFAEAITRLLTDDMLYARLSHNAASIRQDYVVEYSLENAGKIWDKVLARIIRDLS